LSRVTSMLMVIRSQLVSHPSRLAQVSGVLWWPLGTRMCLHLRPLTFSTQAIMTTCLLSAVILYRLTTSRAAPPSTHPFDPLLLSIQVRHLQSLLREREASEQTIRREVAALWLGLHKTDALDSSRWSTISQLRTELQATRDERDKLRAHMAELDELLIEAAAEGIHIVPGRRPVPKRPRADPRREDFSSPPRTATAPTLTEVRRADAEHC
jgi:hypothetical protein